MGVEETFQIFRFYVPKLEYN